MMISPAGHLLWIPRRTAFLLISFVWLTSIASSTSSLVMHNDTLSFIPTALNAYPSEALSDMMAHVMLSLASSTGTTSSPTAAPTDEVITSIPSLFPSLSPSQAPIILTSSPTTIEPTYLPSFIPTDAPLVIPESPISFDFPTFTPTVQSSVAPTIAPTVQPSVVPSFVPSVQTMPIVTVTAEFVFGTFTSTSLSDSEQLAVRMGVLSVLQTPFPTLSIDNVVYNGARYARMRKLLELMASDVIVSTSIDISTIDNPQYADNTTELTSTVTSTLSTATSDSTLLVSIQSSATALNVTSFSNATIAVKAITATVQYPPSYSPTVMPSAAPSATPTLGPTASPTALPTVMPTASPTWTPSVVPSIAPSAVPTASPTFYPTVFPSSQPTTKPSQQPSSQPTSQPYSLPTQRPSSQPTNQPSSQPSLQPSSQPSSRPTSQPSRLPSAQPNARPTSQPSSQPSSKPSTQPSSHPTLKPTSQPTTQPSLQPSVQPTNQPSMQPTMQPTSQPSRQPTGQPTTQPSTQPSSKPSTQPSSQPSRQPSTQPSRQPSRQPLAFPTSRPSRQPSSVPTRQPSTQPTSQPSRQPIGKPTSIPSSQPTSQPTAFLSFSVRFSNDGSLLYVSFTHETDLAGKRLLDVWPCSDVFSLLYESMSGLTCYWSTSTTLVMSLPTGSTIQPMYSRISVKSGTVGMKCYSSSAHCNYKPPLDNVLIGLPDSAIVPNVILVAPVSVNYCETEFSMNPTGSTGHGGRSWLSTTWSIVAANMSAAHVQAVEKQLNAYTATSQLVKVPMSLFDGYDDMSITISLTLRNFLYKSSSTSVALHLVGKHQINPRISITSNPTVVVKSLSILTVNALVELPSCVNLVGSIRVRSSWSVRLENGTFLSWLKSSSNDVNRFVLPSYSLRVNQNYVVTLTSVAWLNSVENVGSSAGSVKVVVQSGNLVSVISGAEFRNISTAFSVVDASKSYDEDSKSTKLGYSWSCTKAQSFTSESCTIRGIDAQTGIVRVYPQETGTFTISVTVYDVNQPQRTQSTQSIFIYQNGLDLAKNISCTLSTPQTKINSGDTLLVSGNVVSRIASTAMWVVSTGKQEISSASLRATTPLVRYFSVLQTASGISFPLQITPSNLQQGTILTISLKVYPTQLNQALSLPSSFSSITVTVNSPPRLGSLAVDPKTGVALDTDFVLLTSGWVDNDEDLPLSYEFRYDILPGDDKLIQIRSPSTSVTSNLPAGPQSLNSSVTLRVYAFDKLLASASVVTNAYVITRPMVYQTELERLLNKSIAFNNTESSFSNIVAVSTQMSVVDCSGINETYCASLHRGPCQKTAFTCSSCLSGYTGYDKDSNLPCVPIERTNKTVIDGCTRDDQCQYNLCIDSKCTAPTKQCPLFETSECGSSGNRGKCVYTINGAVVNSLKCTILNPSCKATCACEAGYGGSNCGLTESELADRDNTRSIICSTLKTYSATTDQSSSMSADLVDTLKEAFDPYEINNVESLVSCQDAMSSVLESAATNSDLTTTSTQSLFETISEFIDISSKELQPLNESYIIVNNFTSTLVSTALDGMIYGQDPVSIITDNLQVTLSKDLSSLLSNSTFQVPSTSAATSSTSLQLHNFTGYCQDSSGYTAVSVGLWSTIPFANSSDLRTGLFRSQIISDGMGSAKSRDYRPKYKIILPIVSAQALYLSSYENETFPSCIQFNGQSKGHCDSCDAIYNDVQVEFTCSSPDNICYSSDQHYGNSHNNLATKVLYQVGATLKAVPIEILNDLGAIDAERIKYLISFVFIGFFFFCFGCIFFWQWDRQDRYQLIYAEEKVCKKLDKLYSGDHDSLINLIEEAVPLPLDSLKNPSFKQSIVDPLLRFHEYVRIFGEKSLSEGRLIRWISLATRLLLNIFLDTLFFSMFYVDHGTCYTQIERRLCETPINAITQEAACRWVEDSETFTAYCELQSPPQTSEFVVMLCGVTLLISYPLSTLIDYACIEYCCKRPNLSTFGLHEYFWLGPAVYLNNNFSHGTDEDEFDTEFYRTNIACLKYGDYCPVHAEKRMFLESVVDFFSRPSSMIELAKSNARQFTKVNRAHMLAYNVKKLTSIDVSKLSLEIEKVKEVVDNDNTRLDKLIYKSRSEAHHILESINNKDTSDVNIALLQYFFLEQLPPLQREIVTDYCFVFPYISPSKVNPLIWVLAWMFIILINAFCVYWIVNFALVAGNMTFNIWGKTFITSFVQDVLFTQSLRVYFIHIATRSIILPRLLMIRNTLIDIVRLRMCKEVDMKIVPLTESESMSTSSVEDDDNDDDESTNVSVSVSVTTSKSSTSSAKAKPITPTSTFVNEALDYNSQLSVIQHTSGACRAARSENIVYFAASQLLMKVNDADIYACQYHIPRSNLGLATLFILAVPAIAGMFGDSFVEPVYGLFSSVVAISVFVGIGVLFQRYIYGFIILIVGLVIMKGIQISRERRRLKRRKERLLVRFGVHKLAPVKEKRAIYADNMYLATIKTWDPCIWRNMNDLSHRPLFDSLYQDNDPPPMHVHLSKMSLMNVYLLAQSFIREASMQTLKLTKFFHRGRLDELHKNDPRAFFKAMEVKSKRSMRFTFYIQSRRIKEFIKHHKVASTLALSIQRVIDIFPITKNHALKNELVAMIPDYLASSFQYQALQCYPFIWIESSRQKRIWSRYKGLRVSRAMCHDMLTKWFHIYGKHYYHFTKEEKEELQELLGELVLRDYTMEMYAYHKELHIPLNLFISFLQFIDNFKSRTLS